MPNLNTYHRPQTIDEALHLLGQSHKHTVIVGGGVKVVPNMPDTVEAVVDLQALGLDQISYTAQGVILGAMVSFQTILENNQAPSILRDMAKIEGPNSIRQATTVGGIVVEADRESEFLAACLVCEAEVQIQTAHGEKTVSLQKFLQDIPTALEGGIITALTLSTLGKTGHARVARTPVDRPIVAAVGRRSSEGNVRVALCGVASTPILIEPTSDVKAAVSPPADFRGSTEYRRQMAGVLVKRVLAQVEG